jgi:transcriptional regulator with XRE-family HTH domain
METTIMAEKGFFAQRLKALRIKANLSQNQLAERSGVSVVTIRHFEYGLREPAFETLLKLARGLGVSLAAFDEEPPEDKPRKRRKEK